MMRTTPRIALLALALLAPVSAQETEERYAAIGTLLDGGTRQHPPVEVVYTMRARARSVVLHFVFERGLYRLSRTGDGRGTTAGIYIEVNDAEQPTHPVRNPFAPLSVDRGRNPDWKEYVARDFPYPNPEPGYWYTWGRTKEVLERPILLRFAAPGRYRIRVRGVVDLRPKDIRVPTLMGVTELGPLPAAEREAPPVEESGAGRLQRAVPTGRRATSVLLLDRDAPGRVAVGESFRYAIRVRNLTGEPIDNVTVLESGEAPMELLEAEPSPEALEDGTLVWELGRLKAGEVRTLEVVARPARPGSLVRSLRVRWDSRPIVQITEVEE